MLGPRAETNMKPDPDPFKSWVQKKDLDPDPLTYQDPNWLLMGWSLRGIQELEPFTSLNASPHDRPMFVGIFTVKTRWAP